MHDIPNFSRYRVLDNPFRIWDSYRGHSLNVIQRNRGWGSVHLIDDTGKRRTLSIITVACLAYHGQQPRGYRAYYRGGTLCKAAVCWLPETRYRALIRAALTPGEQLKVKELYFSGNYTQDQLAQRFNVSQTTISRIINSRRQRA